MEHQLLLRTKSEKKNNSETKSDKKCYVCSSLLSVLTFCNISAFFKSTMGLTWGSFTGLTCLTFHSLVYYIHVLPSLTQSSKPEIKTVMFLLLYIGLTRSFNTLTLKTEAPRRRCDSDWQRSFYALLRSPSSPTPHRAGCNHQLQPAAPFSANMSIVSQSCPRPRPHPQVNSCYRVVQTLALRLCGGV